MAKLLADLTVEPAEALAFFRRKGLAFAFDHTDVYADANVQAFAVAKATTADVLRTFRGEVERAIAGEITFDEFKRTLRPRLEALGWWGKQELLEGDTGEIRKVQLGSDRRLRTIFQTNVQTAYMAGRYNRFLENAADRPYWRYVAIMDGRTRPAHAALNGKVWRYDDPIWAVIWPPNGWGCRCRVQALTEAEFQALGVPLEDGSGSVVELKVPVNRDGDEVVVKGVKYLDSRGVEKVFRPDPGWDYNPGEAWARFDPVGFQVDQAEGLVPTDGLRSWRDLGRPALDAPDLPLLPQPPASPSLGNAAQALERVRGQLLGDATERVLVTPLEEVALRAAALPTSPAAIEAAPFVLPTLENPLEVWLTVSTDGVYRKRYIAVFEGGAIAVVRENRDGTLVWALQTIDQANALRRGALVYSRKPS